MWELTTNHGKYLLTCKPTNEQVIRYTRAKLAQGYKYSEILFCYGQAYVTHSCKGIVENEEVKHNRCERCKRVLLNGKCSQITGNCIEADNQAKLNAR